MVKQVMSHRISRIWLERLDGEKLGVVHTEIDSWVSQDLLATRASVDYCKIGMTAIVIGDVNAVYTLGWCHRRHLLAARALNERSLLVRGPSFWRTKTIGDVCVDDFVILSILQVSDVHVGSSPIEAQRADALYDFFQMPTNASKSGSTFSGEFWRGRLNDVSGMLGFHLERRVSLMLITVLVAAVGVNRTLLRRLLEGWAFARLDVSYTATATLPPSRRCRVNGALLNELLFVAWLVFLLETYLRAELARSSTLQTPHQMVLAGAPRPSRRRIGSPSTSWPKKRRTRPLYWKGEEPPSNMHGGRAAVAPLALEMNWATILRRDGPDTTEAVFVDRQQQCASDVVRAVG